MAVKVKVDMSVLSKRVKQIEDGVKSNEVLNQIGDVAIKDIKYKTRTGQGFNGEKRAALPSLSEYTVEQRKKLSQSNKTNSVFSPERSNLTLTGQLLDSLVKTITMNKVSISPDGKRRGYKVGSKRQSSPSNQTIAKGLKEKGFDFLGIDDDAKKKIDSTIRRFLRRLLKRS